MKFFLLYVCKYQGRPVKALHKMQGTIEMLLLALFSCLFLLSSLSPSCSYLPSSFHSPIFVTQLNSTCLSDSLLKQTRSKKKEEVTCISRTDFTLKTYAGGPPHTHTQYFRCSFSIPLLLHERAGEHSVLCNCALTAKLKQCSRCWRFIPRSSYDIFTSCSVALPFRDQSIPALGHMWTGQSSL